MFQISLDSQVQQRRGLLHEAAHVAGEKPEEFFLLLLAREIGNSPAHVATFPVQHPLPLLQRQDLFLGEAAIKTLGVTVPICRHRLLQIVPNGDTLEQAADHVEHLVRSQLPADRLQLVEQGP